MAREGFAYYVASAGAERSPESVTRARVAAVEPGTDYVAVGPEEFRGPTAPLLELRRAEPLYLKKLRYIGKAARRGPQGKNPVRGHTADARKYHQILTGSGI